MRWSRFRGIRSALPMYVVDRSPASKANTRLCSRKRPTIERTRMFSERPSTPGRSAQVERAIDVDLRARLRGRVELVDDARVDEVVHLEPDARRLAFRRGRGDRADLARRGRFAA